MHKLTCLFLAAAMLFSCAKFEDSNGNDGKQPEAAADVFNIAAANMTVMEAVNSAAAGSNDAMSVSLDNLQTRAVTDDAGIHSAYMLQFNGTDPSTATLVKKMEGTMEIVPAGSPARVSVDLDKNSNYNKVNNRIYFITNVPESTFNTLSTGTTLGAFLAWDMPLGDPDTFTSTGSVPMIGYVDMRPVDVPASAVTVTRVASKLNLTITTSGRPPGTSLDIESVTVKNAAQSVMIAPAAGDVVTAGVADYDALLANAENQYSFYMPESLRGTVSTITSPKDKGTVNAPADATYVEVVASYRSVGYAVDVLYTLYLGGNNTSDFNVLRNTIYNVTLNIKGASVNNDTRVTTVRNLSVDDLGNEATANSYIVPDANETYSFDAKVQGNGATITPTASANDNMPGSVPGTMVPTEAFVIWQTYPDLIKSVSLLPSGKVVFTTGSVTDGNALIGIKDADSADGEVAWSWHIWKTSDDPQSNTDTYLVRDNVTGNFTASAEIVMDRNLGATSIVPGDPGTIGLMYQWGRKDPFLGPDAYSAGAGRATVQTNGDYAWRDGLGGSGVTVKANRSSNPVPMTVVDYARKHPTEFLARQPLTGAGSHASAIDDWLTARITSMSNSGLHDLWGNPNTNTVAPSVNGLPNSSRGGKSIYDPCPIGWKVAPQNTWTAFTSNGNYTSATGSNPAINAGTNDVATYLADKGWNFYYSDNGAGNTAFYPITGYKDPVTGEFKNVLSEGYSWSSSSFGGDGVTDSGANPYGKYNYQGGALFYAGSADAAANPLEHLGRAAGLPVRCVKE